MKTLQCSWKTSSKTNPLVRSPKGRAFPSNPIAKFPYEAGANLTSVKKASDIFNHTKRKKLPNIKINRKNKFKFNRRAIKKWFLLKIARFHKFQKVKFLKLKKKLFNAI
jgi:hypothetical protein